jgi:iron complex outermembrane receptor protein
MMKQPYTRQNYLEAQNLTGSVRQGKYVGLAKNYTKSVLSLVFILCFMFCTNAYAQEVNLTGTLVDAKGLGVPGASVYIKGTTRGTVTDIDGKYQLKVSNGEVIIFQSIGYLSQEVIFTGQTTLDVTFKDDVQSLEEIVVVGYGVQQKKDLTGAVTKISSEDFNPGPITNPLQQINGRAAGVNINQVGSEPGVAPSIRIRGITSLVGGNDPLVVVDGIQGDLGLLNQIPPSEIASIDILKDASATAIYGSRGAAGVLLVTTKKGKEGKTVVEYNGVFSVETIAKKLDVLTADQYRAVTQERGITGFDKGGNTDWVDLISRTGYTQNHNFAFGGGKEGFTYRASLTAILQDGIVLNSGSENYIARVQAEQKALNNKLTLTYNLNISNLQRRFNGPGAFGDALGTRPTNPAFVENTDEYFVDTDLFNYTNPLARVKEIVDGDNVNSLFGSMRAAYEIVDGLTATAFGSWRLSDRTYEGYQSRIATADGRDNNGIGVRNTNRNDERLFNFILNYRKSFGDHSIDVMGVYEWQKGDFQGNSIRGINFPNDNLGASAIQNAGTFPEGNISSYRNDRTLVSFLGRANYSFKGRYILTASFRRDGSSVFGANNKWANFPSVSMAWRISDEGFMSNQNVVDDLKLRAGFGITGNQQGIGPLNSVVLVRNTGNTFFGGELIRNFSITQNANPNLRWETREMYNVGLDFAFLNGRLGGSLDFFYGTTKDLLFNYQVPVPPYLVNNILANVGEATNQGIEFSLNYLVLDNDDFKLTLGGNFSSIRTRVVSLNGRLPLGEQTNTDFVGWGGADIAGVGGQNNDMSYLIQGQSLGTFYLFRHAGIDDNGNQLVDDINGNGQIDQGRLSGDRYIAGQALPKFNYAFTPNLSYKNWNLSMVIRGAYGHKVYNVRRAQLSLLNRLGQSNVLQDALSTGMRNVNEASATDFWLEDGGFTRMENMTIGYRFNTSGWNLVEAMNISFTGNNLFVISGYKGLDPEVRNDGGGGAGIDTGIYPRTRNFAIGLNITFK